MMPMREAWFVAGSPEHRSRIGTTASAVAAVWQHQGDIRHARDSRRTPGVRNIGRLCMLLCILMASATNPLRAAEDDLDITMTVIADPDTFDISNARELQLPAALTVRKRALAAGGESDPLTIGEPDRLFVRPELPGLGRGTSGAVSISAHPDNVDDSRLPGFAGESDLATDPEPPQALHESPQTPNRDRDIP